MFILQNGYKIGIFFLFHEAQLRTENILLHKKLLGKTRKTFTTSIPKKDSVYLNVIAGEI